MLLSRMDSDRYISSPEFMCILTGVTIDLMQNLWLFGSIGSMVQQPVPYNIMG